MSFRDRKEIYCPYCGFYFNSITKPGVYESCVRCGFVLCEPFVVSSGDESKDLDLPRRVKLNE